ncbi:hypothetical protein GBA52_024196 [Prunus armeniaca]|nr:hypothetical protein GBA52_024196 [Prunus armeniaca]
MLLKMHLLAKMNPSQTPRLACGSWCIFCWHPDGAIRRDERFEYGYRSNEIPAWLSRRSTESTITIPLPHDVDGKSKWIKLALCFICEAAQKHDSLEDVPEFDEELGVKFTRIHRIELYTTEDPHEHLLALDYRDCNFAGPFIHWCFIAQSDLAESTNKRLIQATITPDSPGTKITGCGASLIYLEDVPKFVRKLNKHYSYCYQGYQPEQEEDGMRSIPSTSGVQTEQEGAIQRGERFEYGYRSNEIPAWLSRQSTESTITIPLPLDLDGKSKWIKLALCFVCEAAQKHDSLEDVPEFDEELGANFTRNHRIELYTTEDHHECPQVIIYRDCNLAGPFIHWCFIPRIDLTENSNRRLIRASITPDSPGTKVTGCGVSLIYLEDVPKFVQKLNKHYLGYQNEQEEDGGTVHSKSEQRDFRDTSSPKPSGKLATYGNRVSTAVHQTPAN